jgi:hypothetical protein
VAVTVELAGGLTGSRDEVAAVLVDLRDPHDGVGPGLLAGLDLLGGDGLVDLGGSKAGHVGFKMYVGG